MKKKKIKINTDSSNEDIAIYIEHLLSLNVQKYELSDVMVLLVSIGVDELKSKGGSAIRFYHKVLEDHPYYMNGIFSVHIIHKGGNKREIRKVDFKKYMLPAINIILEYREKK